MRSPFLLKITTCQQINTALAASASSSWTIDSASISPFRSAGRAGSFAPSASRSIETAKLLRTNRISPGWLVRIAVAFAATMDAKSDQNTHRPEELKHDAARRNSWTKRSVS
jgi:hypothetical protein